MVSTFTPNINLEEPARGDYVGTWDTPVNANETLTDLVVGGATTIALNNSPVVLASAQFQCKTITFNSTLTGSVTITFPTSFIKSYEIYNTCTGSSAFTVTLQTTAAGAGYVCAPPGTICEVVNIAGQIRFKNLGMVGTYWDYAGSSVPAWVIGSNPVPYLNCDGTTFAAATFPQLAVILGSTTLPDSRGRSRYNLNQTTGRLTSSGAGIDGNTNLAAGGNNGVTLTASNIPSGVTSVNAAQSITVATSAGSNLAITPNSVGSLSAAAGGAGIVPLSLSTWGSASTLTGSNSITVVSSNASQTVVANAAPGYVGGITLIRAG